MGVLTNILEVFSGISTWFTDAIASAVSLFYTAPVDGGTGSLTFLGATAIAGLGISVVMLVLNIVKDYIRFK